MSDFTAYAEGVVQQAIAAKTASDAKAKAANRSQQNNRGRSNVRRPAQRSQAVVVAAPSRKASTKQGKPAQPAKAATKK